MPCGGPQRARVGVENGRGRQGCRTRTPSRSHACDPSRRGLATVPVVGARSRATGAVAVVRARDAVAALARDVRVAIADRILAQRVHGAADVDRAAPDHGRRLAAAVVRGPRSGARAPGRAVRVVRARDALAGGALRIRAAIAAGVRRIASEQGALVAAAIWTRVRSLRDAGTCQLAIEAVATTGACAVAPARHIVLTDDLDALAASALAVVRAKAPAGRLAVTAHAVAGSEWAGREPRPRRARATSGRAPTTRVAASTDGRLCHADAAGTSHSGGAREGRTAAAAVGGIVREVGAPLAAARVVRIARVRAPAVFAHRMSVGSDHRARGATRRAVERIAARVRAGPTAIHR